MLNMDWSDLYDEATGTHMRVSPAVLEHLGAAGALQVALHLKARNPPASLRNALHATGYRYTANGLELFAGVFLLKDPRDPDGGRVPVFLIDTFARWQTWHVDREQRN